MAMFEIKTTSSIDILLITSTHIRSRHELARHMVYHHARDYFNLYMKSVGKRKKIGNSIRRAAWERGPPIQAIVASYTGDSRSNE